MPLPHRQSLSTARWTVRAVGDLLHVPATIRSRVIPASVPGCIHTDLMDAGLIPDPAVGTNEKEVQWVSWTDWRYECEFDADPALFPHHEIDLNFECLDTIATIELNGLEIGKAASEFIPWRFGVLGILKPGQNTLAVSFTSPLRHVHEMAAKLGPRPHNGDEQGWAPFNMIRKCASNFGWDWGPRVATCGIAGDVVVDAWSGVRISNIHAEAVRSDSDLWRMRVVPRLVSSRAFVGRKLALRSRIHTPVPEGDASSLSFPIAQAEDGIVENEHEVWRPRVWHPQQQGEPSRHDVDIEVLDIESADDDEIPILASATIAVAFRDARLHVGGDGNFQIQVNGEPLFIKGANWIPEGLWPRDRTPQRVRQRLQQLLDANMNMIRVWGGGRYEPDWFYDLCDEMGIMVWQDFMFACACYPEEEPLRSLIEREARHQVARLSRHPSVVLWCGGNECHWAYESWGFKERLAASNSPKTWGEHYWREMLPNIVAERSPGTPYWPDSPWSGEASTPPNSADTGDRHTWDAWGDGYRAIVPRFCSEFGQQAPSNWRTLEEAGLIEHAPIASDQSRDHKRASKAHNEIASPNTHESLPHARVSDLLLPPALTSRQLGPGGNTRWYDEPMREWFREPRNLDEWHAMAQLLQARSLRIGIEWMRANRPRCMGALVWQLNDAWPGMSWSLIDSAGRPKLAYEAVSAAFAGMRWTFQPMDGHLHLVFLSDDVVRFKMHGVRVRRMRLDGTVLSDSTTDRFRLAPSGLQLDMDVETLAGPLHDPDGEFYVADEGLHRATWFAKPDRVLRHCQPQFTASVLPRGGPGTILQITAHSVIRDPWIDTSRLPKGLTATLLLDSPHSILLPGERAHVLVLDESTPSQQTVLGLAQLQELLRPPVFWSANGFAEAVTT